MDTLTQVPFLAIILGSHQPTEADAEKLRELYAKELGPNNEFKIEHYPRYHLYGEMPTANDEAVQQRVGTASKQVAVLIPRGADYEWGASGLESYAKDGVRLHVFYRP